MRQKNTSMFGGIAWPTVGLIVACYAVWGLSLWVLPQIVGALVCGVAIALHASLQHEVIHGHPTRIAWLNDLMIWPPLMVTVPYMRFKATHLAHHKDAVITDPYDDPESNYLAAGTWDRLPTVLRAVLRFNNTIAGRLSIGPFIGSIAFVLSEWRMRSRAVAVAWLVHVMAVAAVIVAVIASPMSLWAYAVAVYIGMAILKLRTFLEHQAHARASGRSVIVERGGVFGFLFLNNNLHVVHHMHPKVAWYHLPALYRSRKNHYLRCNGGYVYQSYGAVMRQYFWRAKDSVAHPLWRRS